MAAAVGSLMNSPPNVCSIIKVEFLNPWKRLAPKDLLVFLKDLDLGPLFAKLRDQRTEILIDIFDQDSYNTMLQQCKYH